MSPIFVLVMLFSFDTMSASKNKRLLLGDPDVILTRLDALERTVSLQASKIQELKAKPQTLTGSTYVRWGRKQCPGNQTEMVYSGFAGSGHYDQRGGAADSVCLSPDPIFDKAHGPDTGRIYGSEYETDFWGITAINQDVPCALCRTKYATTVMIPGTKACYDGWHREYYGYLTSGVFSSNSASAFLCVDIQPQFLDNGKARKDGRLYFNVLAKCGSLPCPPYQQDHPLMCVVCSK